MSEALLANLAAYNLQIACIVLAGSALPLVLRTSASLLHGWWRCLVVIALALPWAYHGGRPATSTAVRETSTFAAATESTLPAAGVSHLIDAAIPWGDAVLFVLIGGTLLHVAWMAVGLLRLRHLRQTGQDAELAEDDRWLQHLLGTRAQVQYVESLAHPVTFGLRQPVVLLPTSLRDHPQDIQRAVLCHELVHVQRRDWGWLVAEELLRAVFWFHPVVRWLLTRIQLTREEVVDEIAVAACGGNRRMYVEALLAFADETRLTPAPAFSKRRHLYHRIVRLSKEAVMSVRRVAFFASVTLALVVLASWLGAGAFPTATVSASQLSAAAGPLETAAHPVTLNNPIPALQFSTLPLYPVEAGAANVDATITLIVTLDQFGRVAEMRRFNFLLRKPIAFTLAADPMPSAGEAIRARNVPPPAGMPEAAVRLSEQRAAELTALSPAVDAMFAAAADALSRWQYAPPAQAPLSFYVRFSFRPEESEAQLVEQGARNPVSMAIATSSVRPAPTSARPAPPAGTSRQGVASGRAGSIGGSASPAPGSPTPGAISAPATRVEPATNAPIRVGSVIRPPVRIKNVPPVYPEDARAARIQGVVIIEATVGADGRVLDGRILRSIPLLDAAALDSVRQWEYEPTLMNGVPVPVIMTVTVQFTLGS